MNTFAHTIAVPYIAKQEVRSVLEAPIVDENFRQSEALNQVSANYDLRPQSKMK